MKPFIELIADLFLFDKAIEWLQRHLLSLMGARKTTSVGLRFATYMVSAVFVVGMTLGIFLLLLWFLQAHLK